MRRTIAALIDRRPLAALAVLAVVGFGAYFAVFGAGLQRPLTLGDMMAMIHRKDAIAAAAGPGKVIVAAGSNGRYSHSCAVLSRELGRPCVNMSVTAQIGPDLLFRKVAAQLGPGDLVYIPMEYSTWYASRRDLIADSAAPWLFRNDRRELLAMGPERTLRAAFSYDPRFAIEALAEMGLARAGVTRRANLETLNAFGDETSNTAEAARPYAAFIAATDWAPPGPPRAGGAAEAMLAELTAAARRRGAVVVGGLPTTFDDAPVPDATVAAIEGVFRRSGAGFVAMEGRSQYPRSAFFDTPFHLQRPWQEAHSRALAERLRPLLPQTAARS